MAYKMLGHHNPEFASRGARQRLASFGFDLECIASESYSRKVKERYSHEITCFQGYSPTSWTHMFDTVLI